MRNTFFFYLSYKYNIHLMIRNVFCMKDFFNNPICFRAKKNISQPSSSQLREYAHSYFNRTMQKIIDWIGFDWIGLATASCFVEQAQVSMMLCQMAALLNEEFQQTTIKFSLEKVEIEPWKNLNQYIQDIAGIVYDFTYLYFSVDKIDFEKAKSLSHWSFFFKKKYSPIHQNDAVSRLQVKMSSLRNQNAHYDETQQAAIDAINKFQRKEYEKAQSERKTVAMLAALQNRSLRSCKDIDQQHQRNIINNINRQILPFLHNINHQSELTPRQVEQIQNIALMPNGKFFDNAITCLNQADLWKIVALISNYNERSGKNKIKKNQTKMVKNNKFYEDKFADVILSSLEHMNTIKVTKSNYFYVVGLFYRKLREYNLYSPPAKRFLMRVLEMLESSSLIKNKIYLRAALRIFENSDTLPSELAYDLARTKPARCPTFVMSQQSYVKNEVGNFIPAHIVHAETIKVIYQIHRRIKQPAFPPTLQFVKLSHNSHCKTITITVSGFLSQRSDKDEEWMQLIHALRSSEIYSLRWKSSSISSLAAYILSFGLRKNPFTEAWNEAEVAGKYLAEILMAHFSDRFVNLVGFSLGTKVIQYCLLHLLKDRKTNLINRVVTMGGVANSRQVYTMLTKTQYPLQWINIRSERDFVIHTLLKFWDSKCYPIGAEDIRAVDGHDVINLDLTSQVSGHLDFVNHHYCFGKMLDLYHD